MNRWLSFFIPKTRLKVASLSEVNRLRANGIKIYHVKKVEEGYHIIVARHRVSDEGRVQTTSFYDGFRFFIVPFFIVWMAVFFLSRVLQVGYDVRGNLTETQAALVKEEVAAHFIAVGPLRLRRSPVDTVATNVKNLFHDYIWVDAHTSGSLLIVDVFDTQVLAGEDAPDGADTLYAAKSGVISYVAAKSCLPLVEVGQVVKAGEPLITCYTPTGFGEDVAEIPGFARGRVYGHVWYEVRMEMPLDATISQVLPVRESGFLLNIGTFSFTFGTYEPSFEQHETRTQVFNPLRLFGSEFLTFTRVHYYEKRDIIIENDAYLVTEIIDDLAKRELRTMLGEHFELVELAFLNVQQEADGMIIKYLAVVNEDLVKR